MLLGTLVDSLPSSSILGDEHGMWSTCLFQMTWICHFFISHPEDPLCICGMGSFPVWSRGSLTIFLAPLSNRKLALNRENFSSPLAASGFWASPPPYNITLNPANKRTDQSLWILDCHWCHWLYYFNHRAAEFSHQHCCYWYICLCTELWWWSDCSFRRAWTTYNHSWYPGKCFV